MATLDEVTSLLASNFSFVEGLQLVRPLALFILGLAIYAWFIFKFYLFLSRREIFEFKIEKEGSFKGVKTFFYGVFYFVKYVILFPLFLLFWMLILSVILAFLAKNSSVESILLISVALVGVVRVAAYYNEDLSKDLAKMMPFALLGVFLVDISYFSVANSLTALLDLAALWRVIVYYLLILIALEFVLRILYLITRPFSKNKAKAVSK